MTETEFDEQNQKNNMMMKDLSFPGAECGLFFYTQENLEQICGRSLQKIF